HDRLSDHRAGPVLRAAGRRPADRRPGCLPLSTSSGGAQTCVVPAEGGRPVEPGGGGPSGPGGGKPSGPDGGNVVDSGGGVPGAAWLPPAALAPGSGAR